MTEERLRELENFYYGMNDRDATEILSEIRRLQAEVELLRPVLKTASELVKAIDKDNKPRAIMMSWILKDDIENAKAKEE